MKGFQKTRVVAIIVIIVICVLPVGAQVTPEQVSELLYLPSDDALVNMLVSGFSGEEQQKFVKDKAIAYYAVDLGIDEYEDAWNSSEGNFMAFLEIEELIEVAVPYKSADRINKSYGELYNEVNLSYNNPVAGSVKEGHNLFLYQPEEIAEILNVADAGVPKKAAVANFIVFGDMYVLYFECENGNYVITSTSKRTGYDGFRKLVPVKTAVPLDTFMSALLDEYVQGYREFELENAHSFGKNDTMYRDEDGDTVTETEDPVSDFYEEYERDENGKLKPKEDDEEKDNTADSAKEDTEQVTDNDGKEADKEKDEKTSPEQKFDEQITDENEKHTVNNTVTVSFYGENVEFDQPPIIENGRTLVPLRAILEALGAEVEWDDTAKTVIASRADTKIRLTIGQTTMYRSGTPITLDVAPKIVNSRTLVPVRAVSEAFGCKVEWNDEKKLVVITEN